MTYLEREPRVGDRVEVTYVGDYRWLTGCDEHGVWAATSTGTQSTYLVPDIATVRVIAPEPAVGDVVTEDMDLPEGSIIEGKSGDLAFRASCDLHDQPCWNHGGDHESLGWLMKTDNWRIVRIGPAQ